ncbi:MAG: type III-A CRISPR-associated RAMP protein Csm5 [Cryomorphaceae bacterium]|nr:type III-A CRISPR-associated RAMP protein Csm5 [Cryomorphaceae bacterium]
MNRPIHKHFEIEIELLSPLVINSGEQLSPLTDYFVEDKTDYSILHYVDRQKLMDQLSLDEKLFQRYQNEVSTINVNKPSANRILNKILEEKLLLVSSGKKATYYGGNTTQLSAIIKSNGLPYIPGSSIKGAIKNAFLYHWLVITEKGKRELSKFVINNKAILKNSINKVSQLTFEVNQLNEKERELRRQKKKLSKKEINLKRKLNESIRKEGKNWNKTFLNFEDFIHINAFSTPTQKGILKQPSGNLSIKDAPSFSFDRIAVATLKRSHLTKDGWDVGLQEYIQSNSVTRTTISFNTSELDWEKANRHSEFGKILYKPSNLSGLFQVFQSFYKDMKDIQQQFGLDIPDPDLAPNETILFLGSGKGIYRNTILMAIKKEYDRLDLNFKNDFLPIMFPKAKKNDTFPVTCSHIKKQPLGWVKITDKTGIYE